jgi:enoyl reductase-like protein
MKDIKDKPEDVFQAIADDYHAQYYFACIQEGGMTSEQAERRCAPIELSVIHGCDKIWNDYYLPALKRIEELEQQQKKPQN